MRRYTDRDRDEIVNKAIDISARNGWSARSGLEVAKSLFNIKSFLVGLGSLLIAAFVIVVFVTDAFDSLKYNFNQKFHKCEENLIVENGHASTRDGLIHFSCRVCYDQDAYTIEPTEKIITKPLEMTFGCYGEYQRTETWIWEIDGVEYCEENIQILVIGDEVHSNPVIFEYGYPKTCTSDGLTDAIKCLDCNRIYLAEPIPMGHEVLRKGERAPDCINTGYTGDAVCQDCGFTLEYGTDIPPADHHYELKDSVEATCMRQGYTGDLACTGCGEIKEHGEYTPETDHSYYYAGRHPYTGKYTYICVYCRRDEFRDTND